MSFLKELERRNVVRVALAYLAAAWLLIEVADTVLPESAGQSAEQLSRISFSPRLPAELLVPAP